MKKLLKLTMMLFITGALILGVSKIDFHVSAEEVTKFRVITGNGKNLGDEVAIGNEHFYIISNNGYKVRMLAKYNLDVDMACGKELLKSSKENLKGTYVFCPQGAEKRTGTNIQKEGIGVPNEDTSAGFIGVPFTTEDHVKKIYDSNSYDIYSGSTIETYVNKYVNSIKKNYGISVKGDLFSYDDMLILIRSIYQVAYNNDLFNSEDEEKAREILKPYMKYFDSFYWTKVEQNYTSVDNIEYNLRINTIYDRFGDALDYYDISGVRPILEVDADMIDYKVKTHCKDNICFTDNDADEKISISDEICVGKECFYVLSNNGYQVKMLSMFNLDLGYNCRMELIKSKAKHIMPSASCSIIPSTYKQTNKTLVNPLSSIGYRYYDTMYGVVEYANEQNYGNKPNSYNGSLAKQFVEKYVEYLKTISNKDFTGTLIRLSDIEDALDESIVYTNSIGVKSLTSLENTSSILKSKDFENLGAEAYPYPLIALTKGIPDWLFNTNYWTRTAGDNEYSVIGVASLGIGGSVEVDTYEYLGIRPLITIPTEIIETGNITISACYICDDELVWTDKPGSSCKLNSDIKTQGMCVNNPKTGIRKIVIISLIVASIMVLGYVLYRRHNRFENV